MSSYQSVSLVHVRQNVVTICVIEDVPDYCVIAEMLQCCELGEVVTAESEAMSGDGGTFEVINAAALLLYGHYDVAQDVVIPEGSEIVPEAFVQKVKIVSVKEIGFSELGDAPRYEAILEITMQREELAALFASNEHEWDACAGLYGDFDDMFL